MRFRVLIKKSLARVLPLTIVFIVLLNIVSQLEDLFLRICGITLSVFGFSLLLITIEYYLFKRLNFVGSKEESTDFKPVFWEPDTGELEELAIVEEENDFGELLEVEDQALQPVNISNPVKPVEQEQKEILAFDFSSENIEELEVIEDSVEELESVDE